MPSSQGTNASLGATADQPSGSWSPEPGASCLLGSTAGAGQLPGPVSWDLLFEGANPATGVVVQPSQLDFGACSMRMAAEQQSITVTNTTQVGMRMAFAPELQACCWVCVWGNINWGAEVACAGPCSLMDAPSACLQRCPAALLC
jgi:hypothetical protein